MSRKVLVIGPPGSGKTFVSKKLKEKGVDAWDADEVLGLSKWIDQSGNTVIFPPNANKNWLNDHVFVWDGTFLADWLSHHQSVYLFGISDNVYELLSYFDRVYYLDVSEDELRKRLDDPERINPMGKTERQKESILKGLNGGREKAIGCGVNLVDATLSPEEILKKLGSD